MRWQVGAVANLVVALAYLAISFAIAWPLFKTGQVRKNRLATATAAIFLTSAVHHGSLTIDLYFPALGADSSQGMALRDAFGWHTVTFDVMTAAVGLWYWSLRKHYGPLMRGAKLFDDLKEKQRHALEINDNIVQGLTVAQMALTLDEKEHSKQALEDTLASARRVISDLLGDADSPETRLGAGDLIRTKPAAVHKEAAGPTS